MQEQNIRAIVNRHGFTDYEFEDLPGMPVCPQCLCFTYTNVGHGCMCSECAYADLVECEANYSGGFSL